MLATNAQLTFRRNPLNTPVYLLATNGIVIQSDGSINVNGGFVIFGAPAQGGPGGFDGGKPANGPGALAGDGLGPGGGKGPGGRGAYAGTDGGPNDGKTYGNFLLIPLVGGSGGGGGNQAGNSYGGAGGGGAILLASDTSHN